VATATRSRATAAVLGLDVDYGNDKGAYASCRAEGHGARRREIITWTTTRRTTAKVHVRVAVAVSPDGRYVISTVKDGACVRRHRRDCVLELFSDQGILVVYGPGERTSSAAGCRRTRPASNGEQTPPGAARQISGVRADEDVRPECHDARTVLAEREDVAGVIRNKEPFKFDVYPRPFNDGEGWPRRSRSGRPRTTARATTSPSSRPTASDRVLQGPRTTLLLTADSDAHIIPARRRRRGGSRPNTRLMNSCTTALLSNGAWLVFLVEGQHAVHAAVPDAHRTRGYSTPPVVLERFTRRGPRHAEYSGVRAIAPDAMRRSQEHVPSTRTRSCAPAWPTSGTSNYPGAVRLLQRGLEIDAGHVELLNAWARPVQQGKSQEAWPSSRSPLRSTEAT